MKIIKFFLLTFSILPAIAKTDFTWNWSGISGIVLSDTETTLYFDPAINRPSIWQVIFNMEVNPDPKLVEKVIEEMQLTRVDAIFISHSHFDHAIDMPQIAKKFNSQVFGTRTTKNIALSYGVLESQTHTISHLQTVEVGKFKITSFEIPHGKILGFYHYCDGELLNPKTPPLTTCDFQMGGNYVYYIEHPEGKFMFIQNGRITKELSQFIASKAPFDIFFQGFANRESNEDQWEKIYSKAKAKLYVPNHIDNFFASFRFDGWDPLPFQDWDGYKKFMKNKNVNFMVPPFLEKQIYSK